MKKSATTTTTTPIRVITRERQQLAEMEKKFTEVAVQQEELTVLIAKKRAHLEAMGVKLDA